MEVKAGSSRVKIYRVVESHRKRFTLAYHEGARRKLRQFADEGEARREAKIIAERLNAGQGDALELTGKTGTFTFSPCRSSSLYRCLKCRRGRVCAAKKIGVPLLAAAKFTVRSIRAKLRDKTVSDVVAEFLQAKETMAAAFATFRTAKPASNDSRVILR